MVAAFGSWPLFSTCAIFSDKLHVMQPKVKKPIRVVGHWTFYVDRQNPFFQDVRILMSDFAAIKIRTPSLYAYRQDLGYSWNAFARGVTAEDILERMKPLAKAAIPTLLKRELVAECEKYSKQVLDGPIEEFTILNGCKYHEDQLVRIKRNCAIEHHAVLDNRRCGFYGKQICGGDAAMTQALREYQRVIIENISSAGRSGVIVLPCGSGKTFIGLGIIATVQEPAVVFVPTQLAADQWIAESLKWSSDRCEISDLGGGWRRVFNTKRKCWWLVGAWGGVSERVRETLRDVNVALYDEIHAWPLPRFSDEDCFRFPLRIGLTGSLSREDDGLLFIHNLVGPMRYHVSCEEMYQQGFITVPQCVELKVPFEKRKNKEPTAKESAINPMKLDVLARLLRKHAGDGVLIFASYNEQLELISKRFGITCLTGTKKNDERSVAVQEFNNGKCNVLGLSKLGSSALDLPRASIGIQLSGSFSSRNEEMQRIGRIMRSHPKDVRCVFYTLVSEGTVEEELSANRQMYMMEHGIPYVMGDSDEVC